MDDAIRTRILQKARALFESRGYRSVTVQDLAAGLGISKKTIYQYFASKEEIANAVVDETVGKVEHALKKAVEATPDPLLGMKEILLFVKDESVRFGPLFLMDMEKVLPDAAERYRQLRERGRRCVTELMQDAQKRGLVSGDIPVPMAVEVLSVCVKALTLSDKRFPKEEALDLFLDIYRKGLAAAEK